MPALKQAVEMPCTASSAFFLNLYLPVGRTRGRGPDRSTQHSGGRTRGPSAVGSTWHATGNVPCATYCPAAYPACLGWGKFKVGMPFGMQVWHIQPA
jgi:hypothetical protein